MFTSVSKTKIHSALNIQRQSKKQWRRTGKVAANEKINC